MKIKKSVEAERVASSFVEGWPVELTEAGALTVRPVYQLTERHAALQGPWERRLSYALGDAKAGEVLLVQLPYEPVDSRVMREVVGAWEAERMREPAQQVAWALAFDDRDYPLDDLRFLWDRENVGSESRPLALIVLRYVALHRRRLEFFAPLRGETARLVTLLPGLPVVSAEILRRLADPEGRVSAHRWSNRIAAMRRAGLLVPLKVLGAEGTVERLAHAEALGRELDRRPTRLYRSVPYDLRQWVDQKGT